MRRFARSTHRVAASSFAAAAAAGLGLSQLRESFAESDPTNKEEIIFSRSEVERHTSKGGIYVTYKDGVYDITSFLENHPGGQAKLVQAAGKDLSLLWKQRENQQHFRSPLAHELLEEMRIGSLRKEDVVTLDPRDVEPGTLQYPSDKVYDCIVVGSGVSGLQAAKTLVSTHGVPSEGILLLEAQDYIGGRVRQMTNFIRGVKIDVGAEFLHGSNTLLTRFAKEQGEPVSEIFCWAHGDGGPLDQPVGKGYGLYHIRDAATGQQRLLRYDAKDPDFVRMNEALWAIALLDESRYSDAYSLHDYLAEQQFSEEMVTMTAGGFANTLCTNARDLSFRQCIRWCRLWHAEHGDIPDEEDGDYTFDNSYSVLVDHLKSGLQIETSSPVAAIHHPESSADAVGLVRLTTTTGTNYFARSVIVTSSPHVLKTGLLQFSPPLPELDEALDSTNMHSIVKVFLKFSRPVWPADLHGMILADSTQLLPEIWFRDVSDKVPVDEPAKAYAVAFTTADYATRLQALPKEEVLRRAVQQLDAVFALLQPEHMAATGSPTQLPSDLPRPSDAYLGGMFWDWTPEHHPYIGGGYCSPRAGTQTDKIGLLGSPLGPSQRLFFAGEATNMPGATAHAALESGVRAAGLAAKKLKH